MTSVLIRDAQRRDAQRDEGHVKNGTKIGVMQPQAKQCLELPKLEEARKHFPLEPLKGAGPC